jgi:hypothetical protein
LKAKALPKAIIMNEKFDMVSYMTNYGQRFMVSWNLWSGPPPRGRLDTIPVDDVSGMAFG